MLIVLCCRVFFSSVTFINFEIQQVSVGFSIAAAVRVGHFIGSGDPDLAKNSLRVTLKLVSK